MAIVKADHSLQEVRLTFNGTGDVTDVNLVVSYVLKDDVTNEVLTQVGRAKSVWASLTPTQQTALDTLGKRFKTLAGGF